jgi:hypothetical protein
MAWETTNKMHLLFLGPAVTLCTSYSWWMAGSKNGPK